MKILSAGILSQNPKPKYRRWRKRKTQRSQEKLARWMEFKIHFCSRNERAALNQTEASYDLKWNRSTVYRHWNAARAILGAKGYLLRRVHDRSRSATTHKRSRNAKLIWYAFSKETLLKKGELFEETQLGKCRYVRNALGMRIEGQQSYPLLQIGGYIGGFVNNKAQKNNKPCSAALHDPTSFEKKASKTIWKLDRKLRSLRWDNCKIDLLPIHTHSLAKEAFKLRLRMESVVEMAYRVLHKWHGIATDNSADGQNLWLSTGWLVDCRRELNSCERFQSTPPPFSNSQIDHFSEDELRSKILESFYKTKIENEEQLLTHVS